MSQGQFLPPSESLAWVPGWIEGLSQWPLNFMRLGKRTRKPTGPFTRFEWARGPKGAAAAQKWLSEGYGIAVVLGHRMWCLDCDSLPMADTVFRKLQAADIEPLMVRTKRGVHFYGLLPLDFPLERLKPHWCHPKDTDGVVLDFDFKFGPHSYCVGPGTIRHGDGITYSPMSPWPEVVPTMDPRLFLPDGLFWHPAKVARQSKALASSEAPAPLQSPSMDAVEDDRPFATYTRSHADALEAGKAFLRSPKRQVSISGDRGGPMLEYVTRHLCGWLKLTPAEAVGLMTAGDDSWNSRCRHKNGDPYPWTKQELLGYSKAAVGKWSEEGGREYARREADRHARETLRGYVGKVRESLVPEVTPGLPVTRLCHLFQAAGLPDLTITALGLELKTQAIPTKRVVVEGVKETRIPGLEFLAMVRSLGGCPVIPLLTSQAHLPPTKRSTNCVRIPDKEYRPTSGHSFPEVISPDNPADVGFSPIQIFSVGYQTGFDWAESPAGRVVHPGSPVLPRLRLLMDHGILGVMTPRPAAELRKRAIGLLFPAIKSPVDQLRQLREEARKAGLVADDGTLTPAGKVALGLQGAA